MRTRSPVFVCHFSGLTSVFLAVFYRQDQSLTPNQQGTRWAWDMVYAYMSEAVNCYLKVENSDRLYVELSQCCSCSHAWMNVSQRLDHACGTHYLLNYDNLTVLGSSNGCWRHTCSGTTALCDITVCTVVQNCCKGDEPCQWNTPIFRPSEIRNPLTDRHETWQEWLRQGYQPTCKFWYFYP